MPAEASEPENNLSPELELALISLTKASQDLVAVSKWLDDPDISDEIIGFHIQQAIEKSFKAVLLCQAIDFPHTHNLGLLIDLCRNHPIQVPSEFLQVDIFNRFAVQWRYDLLPATPQMDFDRPSAYHLTEQVWNWAKNLVNEASQ